MNEKYVIDAYAWVEYLIGSEAGGRVRSILEEENNKIPACAATVAEVASKTAREGLDFQAAYYIIKSNSHVIDASEELQSGGLAEELPDKLTATFQGLLDSGKNFLRHCILLFRRILVGIPESRPVSS